MDYSYKKLRVSYCRNTDTLEVDNGDPAQYSYVIAESLTANLNAGREVVGFTLENARSLLLYHLSEYKAATAKLHLQYQPTVLLQDNSAVNERKMLGRNPRNMLHIGYLGEYDTLDIWNEKGASFGWDVGDNLVAFSRDDEGKEINGFTLECAAQLLLPCLSESSPPVLNFPSGG
jgi:hypothetical protein